FHTILRLTQGANVRHTVTFCRGASRRSKQYLSSGHLAHDSLLLQSRSHEREVFMVSPLPLEEPTPAPSMPSAPTEEPFGEQFFPRQMSWYAAEGPQGNIEAIGRWVRENPWAAVGIAVGAGLAVALLAPPLLTLGMRGVRAAYDGVPEDAE